MACEKPKENAFGQRGSLHDERGKSSFRFGTASAATQIEDNNPNTDWYAFTRPKPEGAGHGVFVGEAIYGYSKALDDVALAADMGLDAYRFSLEWARMEPTPGVYSEEAFAHYDAVLKALSARNLKPMVTLQHFSFPSWASPPNAGCDASGKNLGCGLETDESYEALAQRMTAWVALVAQRYGNSVDEWYTLNEPINYILASYATGTFPPGKTYFLSLEDKVLPILRRYFDLHARLTKTLRENDLIDADGDGHATSIGLGLSLIQWVPARHGKPSAARDDVKAKEKMDHIMRNLPIRSFLEGAFDSNLDGIMEENHPEWKGTLDWVGLQTYTRSGVTGSDSLLPLLGLVFCFDEGSDFGLGACIPPEDESYFVPAMKYAWGSQALLSQLRDLHATFPSLPLVVTESGIASVSGRRKSEVLVRSLENILTAQAEGVDVRGYYYWTLIDNFEWHLGYAPKFGLFRVDENTFQRIPTSAVETYKTVVKARALIPSLKKEFGGNGPLSEEKWE